MFKKYFWLISAISFVSGLSLVYYFNFIGPKLIWFIFVLLFLFLLLLIKLQKVVFLVLFFLFLAIWRYLLLFPDSIVGRIENYYGQELTLVGRIIAEPELKDDKQKIKFEISYGLDENDKKFKLQGRALVSTQAYPLFCRDDYLIISGEWLRPGVIEDFDYNLYLRRYGISSVSYYPKIKKTTVADNKIFFKKTFRIINNFKNKIAHQFDFYLSLESASILKAMMLNDKSGFDAEMNQNFSRSGLSHIIAISGMHISMLSAMFLSFLLFIGLSRQKSFYFSVLFLIFYLILIGAPASACRASLMGFLSFLAVYMGRPGNLINILFFSGIFLVFLNPWLLFGDMGFQLSFLAVVGIIYVYPIVKDFFYFKVFKKTRIPEAILDILCVTIAVQLIAGPILIAGFKQFSLVAPLSNLLVVWTLSFLLSLTVVAIVSSAIFPFLGQLIYLLVDIIIKYIFVSSRLSGQLPGAVVAINNWSIYFSIVYYLLLIYLLRKLAKQKQSR